MGSEASLKGSSARLWKLVEERTHAGADIAAIDQRIWDLFGEEWAIMFTDLVGLLAAGRGSSGSSTSCRSSSSRSGCSCRSSKRTTASSSRSRPTASSSSSRQPAQALACAIAMQQTCQSGQRAARRPRSRCVLCVGIGFGKILQDRRRRRVRPRGQHREQARRGHREGRRDPGDARARSEAIGDGRRDVGRAARRAPRAKTGCWRARRVSLRARLVRQRWPSRDGSRPRRISTTDGAPPRSAFAEHARTLRTDRPCRRR